MTRSVKVGFAAPREVAFDFLVDPHNRMQWQSGLRAVEDVQPMPPQVGPRDSPNFARLDQTPVTCRRSSWAIAGACLAIRHNGIVREGSA